LRHRPRPICNCEKAPWEDPERFYVAGWFRGWKEGICGSWWGWGNTLWRCPTKGIMERWARCGFNQQELLGGILRKEKDRNNSAANIGNLETASVCVIWSQIISSWPN
jgi:hypothetical protein